jgi:hypothetical protein
LQVPNAGAPGTGCEFGGCAPIGNAYTNPIPSEGGLNGASYTFYTYEIEMLDPANQWVMSSRGLVDFEPFWRVGLRHWYFYNTGTGESKGLGPSGWESAERNAGHIVFIPSAKQSQCIDSKIRNGEAPPDYYWAQFRSNAAAINCRGYCTRVLHSCGL